LLISDSTASLLNRSTAILLRCQPLRPQPIVLAAPRVALAVDLDDQPTAGQKKSE
jgi:hypothetical protein